MRLARVAAPDIRAGLWEKFIALAATGGVMARLPMGPYATARMGLSSVWGVR